MAGIGFELKRVIEKGGVLSFLKAAFSGVMIVAGPWIISIVSIFIIGRLMVFLPGIEQQVFIAVIIYTYAFSLILFGGIHFIFTRLVADMIYENKPRVASSLLVFFFVLSGIAAAGIGAAAAAVSGIQTSYKTLLYAGGGLLFGSVSCIWIVMLFVSLIKWYGRILLTYLVGMGAAVAAMLSLARLYGIAGAVFGFAAGQLLIAAALLFLSLREYSPGKFGEGRQLIGPYIKRYKFLFLTGQFYPLGIWADKILFWFLAGTPLGTTIFRLYPPYDIAVYISTLTMIPGLVYFVIGIEPDVYVYLKKFLLSLNIGKLREIQVHKYAMLSRIRADLKKLTFFGTVVCLCFVLLIPNLLRWFSIASGWNYLLLSFVAVFAHFSLLVYMNVLFYLNFYRHTCIASFLFFGVNIVVSAGLGAAGIMAAAGAGYLCGAAVSAVYCYAVLFREGKKIDRYILSGKSV